MYILMEQKLSKKYKVKIQLIFSPYSFSLLSKGTHHLNDECLIYSIKHFTNKVSFSFNLKLNSSAR